MSAAEILEVLKAHGIQPTPQRIEIAEIVLEKPQHLSAEQIIESLKRRGSSVSKATVYNSLNLFGERGLVKELLVDPVRKFYDSTTRPHHHFYNVDTGELLDIDEQSIQLSGLPLPPEGTQQESVEVLIRVRRK